MPVGFPVFPPFPTPHGKSIQWFLTPIYWSPQVHLIESLQNQSYISEVVLMRPAEAAAAVCVGIGGTYLFLTLKLEYCTSSIIIISYVLLLLCWASSILSRLLFRLNQLVDLLLQFYLFKFLLLLLVLCYFIGHINGWKLILGKNFKKV